MAIKKLGLTRDQLASFLDNHEKIKQFENLFNSTNEQIDISEGVIIEAGAAYANANLALDLLYKFAQDSETNSAAAYANANLALDLLYKFVQDSQTNSATAEIKAQEALLQIENLKNQSIIDFAAIESKINHSFELIKSLLNAVDSLQMLPAQVPPKRARFAQFYDTTIQTAAAINTAYAITYNTTDLSYGVFLRPGNSEIQVDTEAVYNFQFSVQLDKTTGGVASFWIWPRINGVNVANSASQVRIQGNDAEIFSAANFFLNLKAGDYVQFMWAVSDTSVQIQYFAAAGVVPAIPSIIVTVSNNIKV